MKASVLLVIVLAGIWCGVYGEFSPGQALLGAVFGTIFVLITGAGRGQSVRLRELPRRLAALVFFLLILLPYDLMQSNLALARRLLRPRPAIQPGIVRLQLEEAPWATVALEEHVITISPGQLVVDYTADSRTIYIHVIDVTTVEAKHRSLWQRYRRILGRIFG